MSSWHVVTTNSQRSQSEARLIGGEYRIHHPNGQLEVWDSILAFRKFWRNGLNYVVMHCILQGLTPDRKWTRLTARYDCRNAPGLSDLSPLRKSQFVRGMDSHLRF